MGVSPASRRRRRSPVMGGAEAVSAPCVPARVTAWLPGYDYRGLLRLDVIAGATVWALLVPEMIAYSGSPVFLRRRGCTRCFQAGPGAYGKNH